MKIYSLILLGGLITGSLFAQEKMLSVPATVRNAFQKAFPGATKVKWEKEESAFEVNFTMGGKEMSAVYDQAGEMKEQEEEIKVSELPAAVSTYLKEHYKGSNIKEAAKITKSDGTVNYEAEVNKKDVIFDAQGKFLKEAKD